MNKRKLFLLILALPIGLLLLTTSSCKKEEPLSNLTGITDFGFTDNIVMDYDFAVDQTNLIIENTDSLPYGTDVSSLVAEFSTIDNTIVKVGDVIQVSGVTENDFTDQVVYTTIAEDGVTMKDYTVKVNVSKINPDAVSWNLITNGASWGPYNFTTATFFNNIIYVFGCTLGSFNAFSGGTFTSTDGATWTEVTTTIDGNEAIVPASEYTGLVTFQDKLWLVGGHAPGEGFAFDDVKNTLWQSSDGEAWTLVTPTDGWSKRERTAVLVYDSKMWVIGGNGYPPFGLLAAPMNDVWSSADGTTWVEATAAASFPARTDPAAFIYDNKMYISGGMDASEIMLNDLWSSTDGVTWTEVTVQTPYSARWGHKVVVYDNKLWLTGGETDDTGDNVLGDMWMSDDGGVNWTQIDSSDPQGLPASFKERTKHSMFIDSNDKLWIIGGRGANNTDGYATYLNDVWSGLLNKLN